ncbi:hypothetical protein [Mycolicibacterium arseniciresistens]|uniref:Uncharacterized protein n=1 Tax=Mycolicibacterium arseniciresistens TaxID=3062257 RepID=A0ABT8UIJ8_9MYCO|nr:hypothetical protein [Mycolicibacterium arseniciresistens]MDO3637629.1 hypothetical protein [Mycolicibacterium arseniciresistens]
MNYIDGDLFVACISQNEIDMFKAVTSEPTALVDRFVRAVHEAAAQAIDRLEFRYDHAAEEYTFANCVVA